MNYLVYDGFPRIRFLDAVGPFDHARMLVGELGYRPDQWDWIGNLVASRFRLEEEEL